MYPVDFEEFAIALGKEILLDYIKECFSKKVPLEQSFHAQAMHLFREYMLVGGMPQSIVAYAESHGNFEKSGVVLTQIMIIILFFKRCYIIFISSTH